MVRKAVPTALKIIAGNPGRRPLNENEPEFQPGIPESPDGLNDDAKKEWDRMVKVLFNAGVMSEADRSAFTSYCQAYGTMMQAEREIHEMQKSGDINGLLQYLDNGRIVENPLLSIARKARSEVVKYAIEFGMTPSSRSKITAMKIGGKKENPFEKLKN
jgi:P27 family predicted phage terminase small subunit